MTHSVATDVYDLFPIVFIKYSNIQIYCFGKADKFENQIFQF